MYILFQKPGMDGISQRRKRRCRGFLLPLDVEVQVVDPSLRPPLAYSHSFFVMAGELEHSFVDTEKTISIDKNTTSMASSSASPYVLTVCIRRDI